MSETLFDAVGDDTRAGFRLQSLEVLNWGTFDQKIWKISPKGDNSLLTGDVGSGKSTLVDALTTLLVPHHRIVYNKAAGAEAKERSLFSYIRGEYKNEKDDSTSGAKAITLRDKNSYTVISAQFHNSGYNQSVTLAQVFWLKDTSRNPERFFIVAQEALHLKEHFSNFGSNVLDLKKRLRKMPHVEVMESFKEYSTQFRRCFGIEHEQALELFYQTISMKSVGNLTQFVRLHMLEPDDVGPRIEELRQNFENLNRAHEAVLKAKNQIELLTPIALEFKKYSALRAEDTELRNCRASLESYFAGREAALVAEQLVTIRTDIEKVVQKLASTRDQEEHLGNQRAELQQSIAAQGGLRLESIRKEIEQQNQLRNQAQKLRGQYDHAVEALEIKKPRDEHSFVSNRTAAENLITQSDLKLKEFEEQQVKQSISLQDCKTHSDRLEEELHSLRSRRSNIPRRNLEIRRAICEGTGANEKDLPFAGELMQVAENEKNWEGSIERVLHGFGLGMLVSEAHYPSVASFVDRTHLHGKIVYYRTIAHSTRRGIGSVTSSSLTRKLRLKEESEFSNWLEEELVSRYDYTCCDSIEEFKRYPFALTQSGQVKAGGKRHEKDDRHSVGDRSLYVLGWTNEGKIAALQKQFQEWQIKAHAAAQLITATLKSRDLLKIDRDTARDLLKFESYADIHWQVFAKRVDELENERKEIESSSNVLKVLQARLQEVEVTFDETRKKLDRFNEDFGMLKQKATELNTRLLSAQTVLASVSIESHITYFRKLDELIRDHFQVQKESLANLPKVQSDVRAKLQAQIDSEDRRIKKLVESIMNMMSSYKQAYPAESKDVDASIDSGTEFASILSELEGEDLPRHEARFKKMLNEGTINSVALLQNHLERTRRDIEEKISLINRSLNEIEYNSGTYIEIVHEQSSDREIRDFRQDLKKCLSQSLQQESLYNEARFLDVKALMTRLNGRENYADLDHKWSVKVTDVRNWYEFSASERWQETKLEKEFYSDSSGKSGGQKEKLAYTILASALAYQFGLEWNVTRSKSFRFVVIDEAFGRGSDESTRYGLELFKKLNLQLLVVTPLQKIHVIEDYIHSVHFIHNDQGSCSVIRNLTIDEYRKEKRDS